MSIFTPVRVFLTSRNVQNGKKTIRLNTELENVNLTTGKGLNIVKGSVFGIAVCTVLQFVVFQDFKRNNTIIVALKYTDFCYCLV